MFLNRERTRFSLLANRSMRRTAKEQLDRIGVNIPSVDAQVAKLSGGQRQAIAVARAVTSNAKVLLLDEPLAAMGAKEAAMILELVKDLKQQGEVSIVIIAHNSGQALEVCDRINLLQHGEITLDKPSKDTSVQELNDIVIEEYRSALMDRRQEQNSAGRDPAGASRWQDVPHADSTAAGGLAHEVDRLTGCGGLLLRRPAPLQGAPPQRVSSLCVRSGPGGIGRLAQTA